MKKSVVISVVLLLVLLTACAKQVPPAQDNAQVDMPVGAPIEISNFAFGPSSLSVKVGDTVTWVNKDDTEHTVTSDEGSELSSDRLAQGQQFSHVFTKAGTYTYHCAVHPGMKGTIIVS